MKVILSLGSGALKRIALILRTICGFSPLRPPSSDAGELPSDRSGSQPDSPTALGDSQPLVRPRRLSERTILVGVDFGTSSTKVIWQDLSNNRFEVIHWRPPNEGERTFLLPSTILFRGSSIHFGVLEAEAAPDDCLLTSIKLCVLCRRKPAICRCGDTHTRREGLVRLPGSTESVPASSLACLFLAHVFQEVEKKLLGRFPDNDLVLIWNVGCPMDHLDKDDLRSQWERMTAAAMALRSRVSNVVHTSILAEVVRLVETIDVPDVSVRNFFVQPEGLAAVKAFLESPAADAKTYAIVDVGAGTTEVSYFFNGRAMAEPGQPFRPSYLADSTDAVGGVRIDHELARAWGCGVDVARKRKESNPHSVPLVESIFAICKQYRRTCGQIGKRLTAENDKRFDLFIIGGGGRLAPIRRALQDCELLGGFVRGHSLKLKPPMSLSDHGSYQEHYDLLSIACGLASSLDWDYYQPHEVDPIPLAPPKPKRGSDEIYSM